MDLNVTLGNGVGIVSAIGMDTSIGKIAEVIQEGLVKVKAEGIQENKKEIAKKLFQSGQTKEFISFITGLSLEELNNILK